MSVRVDPYCYPGTNVPVNNAGFRLQTELDLFEADAVLLAAASLNLSPITGQFDQARLLETHRRLFHPVYAWAGQLRQNTGRMAKLRESGRVISCGPSEHVPAALAAVFADLNEDRYLCELDATDLAERVGFYYSEIDAIHPFREGNSRTLRVFFPDLCRA
jgi:fido (protein-threonine AMPylation protein)